MLEGTRPPGAVGAAAPASPPASSAASSSTPSPASRAAAAALPLSGVRIALDPGHQLGNHNFPAQINRLVPAGGFSKPCNTTGTSTNGGYAEATLNFRVARLVQARLQALGAEVAMTRTRNSEALWGPCVDARGEFGARVGATLMVSLHADGAPSADHGFHVIAPTARSPWTTDIAAPSLRLAKALRSGFDALGIPRSTYVGHGSALSIRSDLGTLNMSDVPAAMLEVGNMRNRSDAHRMTTLTGRVLYARAVVRGIRAYLSR
ncbi:N-acetylmuramoyl-L-alanine amidase [Nocardioides pocheonensis]|uniref:N-acetylmuramoyl-L-alanine amidase n=1 Tax=Nocardioides pocheonensis TaxID=661485 RepID=A0A3N0GYU5_9ACTN|nr:N-acetylmuramoyl-L-alanine amidase [Nocardioides pocheonensis]